MVAMRNGGGGGRASSPPPSKDPSVGITSAGPGRLKGAGCHGQTLCRHTFVPSPLDPQSRTALTLPPPRPLIMVSKTCPKPPHQLRLHRQEKSVQLEITRCHHSASRLLAGGRGTGGRSCQGLTLSFPARPPQAPRPADPLQVGGRGSEGGRGGKRRLWKPSRGIREAARARLCGERNNRKPRFRSCFRRRGRSPFPSRQTKGKNAPVSPELRAILFSLRTPSPLHTRKIQTVDRGHVRAAPVICQLITRLSTARLSEEGEGRREGGGSGAFPVRLVWETCTRRWRFGAGPLLRGTGLRGTASLSLPEARPFPYQPGDSLSRSPVEPRTGGSPGSRER